MKQKLAFIVLPPLMLLACGSGDGPSFDAQVEEGTGDTGCETSACASHEDCDDSVACTRDTCVIGGCCEHVPDDDECPDGQTCDPVAGCVDSECDEDADCDDGLDCTNDTCLFDHTCENADTCPPGQHCEATGCVENTGDCTVDDDCANGVFCDGDEWCDPEFGCQPPEGPRECVDDDDCTVDACDTTLDMCTFTCDSTLPGCSDACPWDPFPGCFSIGTTIAQRCALGYVDYSFNQICFSIVGLSLQATAGTMTLSEVPAPTGTHFSVTHTVEGDCDEYYNITGDFSDEDHFTATWTATFTGGVSCTLGGCANQSIPVTGTRL